MQLKTDRPILFFDLETTGRDPGTDRIVEISVLRVEPDGSREVRTRRVNPERPIPAGASAVHGIYDEDVRDLPPFRRMARGLLDFIEGCDLAGFNILRFDLPLLEAELKRCGLDLDAGSRRIVDVMRIYHRKEPRDLSAALRFYLGREHDDAHAAEADVQATVDVLEAQLARYDDVPAEIDALAAWLNPRPADAIDREGKFRWQDGSAIFGFGRFAGRTLQEVADEAPDYLQWICGADFPDDAREIVREALDGRFPTPPAAAPPEASAG